MKKLVHNLHHRAGFLVLLPFLLLAASASAVTLSAVETRWNPPNGNPPIAMWSFIKDLGACPTDLPFWPDDGLYPWVNRWEPGPPQQGTVNGTLSISLRNCLSEPVSLIIPGLEATLTPQTFVDSKGRTRVRAFTREVPADNGTTLVTYTWRNLRAGTYLYQSGSNPAKQVHMGLFGALTVGKNNEADNEAIVLFSEIDPALHSNAEAATPRNYKPKYFLINGKSALPGDDPPTTFAGKPKETLHLRFLNAGFMTHVPTLLGPYMQVYAEDGFAYPYPKEQYSVLLPAGKTVDALWRTETHKLYPLFDRRLFMTTNGVVGGGMLQHLDVPGFPWKLFIPAFTGKQEEITE